MKNRNPFAIRIWRLETRDWKLELRAYLRPRAWVVADGVLCVLI